MYNPVKFIGGIFIYSSQPAQLADWYRQHLGITFEEYGDGSVFYKAFGYVEAETGRNASLVWSIMENKSRPSLSEKVFTVNYRVDNIDNTISHLRESGITVNGPEDYPQGKFAWLEDCDGNPIELWEDTSLSPA